jgi:hypothetical protein
MPDPNNSGRRVFAIECKELADRLFLVVPEKQEGAFRLVCRDKAGKVEAVLTMVIHVERPQEPCHPGCFPAGTLVETPNGTRKIESIKPGDSVTIISDQGKPGSLKVNSLFVGLADMVELETDIGKFVTTTKQPLLLANGGIRSAGSIVAGDAVLSWKAGKQVAVKVKSATMLSERQKVHNLVLEQRGTFIAGGYLVRSKPPAEK